MVYWILLLAKEAQAVELHRSTKRELEGAVEVGTLAPHIGGKGMEAQRTLAPDGEALDAAAGLVEARARRYVIVRLLLVAILREDVFALHVHIARQTPVSLRQEAAVAEEAVAGNKIIMQVQHERDGMQVQAVTQVQHHHVMRWAILDSTQ